MGDDHPCNVRGIDKVCIKIFDGKIRELQNVRNVSQLKRNLISVGVLKILGLEIVGPKAHHSSFDDDQLM